MSPRRWVIAAALIADVSAAALAVLASGKIIPSVVRDLISDFAQPGVTVWWLFLAGPFRSAPSSPTGIAFAAAANTVLWLLAIWCAMVILHASRRMFRAR